MSDQAEKFIILKKAYDILNKEETRKHYNEHLEGLSFVQATKDGLSEKRKYFAEMLRKREEEIRAASQRGNSSQSTREDLVNEYLKKKRRPKAADKVYTDPEGTTDEVGQKHVNELLESQRQNKEQLQKLFATIKVKWSEDGKVYTKSLLRVIFARFGRIADLSLATEKNKCFIQYSNVTEAARAMKHFEEQDDFKIKFLIIENREALLKKFTTKETGFELNTDILNKITGLYNGYSYEDRKSQMDKQIERLRYMKTVIDASTKS